MQDILIVVDMQNDFIDGALGTPEAVAIVPAAAEKIRSFPGTVLFTRDTHPENYLETQEGRNLPVGRKMEIDGLHRMILASRVAKRSNASDTCCIPSSRISRKVKISSPSAQTRPSRLAVTFTAPYSSG